MSDRPRAESLTAALDSVSDQLATLVDGDFALRVRTDSDEIAVQKLVMLTNFAIASARAALGEIETLSREKLALEADRQRALRLAIAQKDIEARRAEAAEQRVLANLSHELRTPLNAVFGFAELIRFEAKARGGLELIDDRAARIAAAGRRLLAIVTNLLEHASIRDEARAIEDAVCDPAILLARAAARMAEPAEAAGLRLEIRCQPDGPYVVGDESAFDLCLENLISNAINASPRGASIRLSGEPAEGGGFRLIVTDEGRGMTPFQVEAALRPFDQTDAPEARIHGGLGLGLSVTAALIRSHDGRLSIETEPGRGLAATLWLPPARLVPRLA